MFIIKFLNALTDPCVLNVNCLQPWLLTEQQIKNSPHLLDVKFSSFEQQPVSYQPPLKAKEAINVPQPTDPWFTEFSKEAGLQYPVALAGSGDLHHVVGGGIAADDFNQDGYTDLFISHATRPGKLLLNNGAGQFQDLTEDALGPLFVNQLSALFFDYDADQDKDLFLIEDNYRDVFISVYENIGNKRFKADPKKAGIYFMGFTHSLALADVDADGDLDLYASHWIYQNKNPQSGYLWQNDGNKRFSDQSQKLPPVRYSSEIANTGLTFTPIFTDIDNDQDPDLLISGDFNTSQVLQNNNGQFVDKTTAEISDENGMGASVGDVDNDGDFDWFVTSIWNPVNRKGYKGGISGNRLYLNDGKGNFQDNTEPAGVREGYWGWGSCMFDFNNDGWLDIFHTNGMFSPKSASIASFAQFMNDPSRLYINKGDGTFSDQAFESGLIHTGQGRGVSCFDYDQDGDIDIFVANHGKHPSLYKNLTIEKADNDKNFLIVKLNYSKNNPDAIGAKIIITTDAGQQIREVLMGSNYLSNKPPLAHFGLGTTKQIHQLKIIWPNGETQVFENLKVNQRKTFSYSPTF